MLQKGDIELSITPFRMEKDRLEFLDFTVLTWVTTPTVVFRHPRTETYNYFFRPLSVSVWLSILFITILLTVCMTFSMRMPKQRIQFITFNRALMTSIGILCQQGFIENFQKLSTRMILYSSILFSITLFQFYSSFIVSSLLTNPPKTITTVRQLIDSHLKVGVEELNYNHDFLDTTTDELVLELYAKKIKPKQNFFDVKKGLKMTKNGGFAFHVDTSYAYRMIQETFSEDEICELQEVLLHPARFLMPPVAKGSDLKEFLRVALQRLIEGGIYNYHTQRWATKKPKCVVSITKVKSVDIDQTSSVLIFILSAVFVSFVVLFIEILCYKSC